MTAVVTRCLAHVATRWAGMATDDVVQCEHPTGHVGTHTGRGHVWVESADPALAAVRRLHQPSAGFCAGCDYPWPCPTTTAIESR